MTPLEVGERDALPLPDRTYPPDAPMRKRLLPFGIQHPAKMHLALCRDLFLRYTQPGQTVLDPFGGVGGSLVGITLGRNVILNELEPPFAEFARQNYDHLRSQALGTSLGTARIYQGDSRRLPLDDADGAISSPPYVDARQSWPTPEGAENVRYGTTLGQIGGRAHGDVAAAISSPPYADLASRDRSQEPSALESRYAESHGKLDANRHVDGYGLHTPGQIGDLRHVDASIGSPPWADANPQGNTNGEKGVAGGDGMLRLKKDYVRFQHPDSIASQDGETYADACLQVYRECHRVVRAGGVLVLVTGNYVRDGKMVDLAADTIKLAEAAGWTFTERWRHVKSQISFWRRLHFQQRPDVPVVYWEDVLVFVKGHQGWPFAELVPTLARPVSLEPKQTVQTPQPLALDLGVSA